ncbi:MAG: pitrilysin family protein, partial [Thermoguttaceae bacterium]
TNGLDVILHEDHSTPIVGVNVWYHVGSKDERPGRTGFAHLFEHMMFQGSKHFDKVYFGPIQSVGGRLNGSTAMDRTDYWETVPSNYLELALWMESDRMGFLLPAMTQAKLDNQRDVVKNERRQSYENRPYGLVHETILAALYRPNHPYSWPTIGSMKDITEASREDIADFFRRYYHPANASLCIAGDFDPVEAKHLVEKYFGPIPAGPKVVHPTPSTPELKEVKRIHMTDRVGLARVYTVWPTPRQFTPEDAALDILGHILAGGKSSRLYRSLVRGKQIAQDVQAYQDGQELTGEFAIVATIRSGHKVVEIEAAIAEEIDRIKGEPPTAEEMDRAINTFEARLMRSLESVSEFGGRADRLNLYNVYTGDPGYMAKDFARYGCVDAGKVTQMAKRFLGPGRVVVEVVPESELSVQPNPLISAEAARAAMAKDLPALPTFSPKVVAEGAGRESLPEGSAEPKFSLPPVKRATLSNGMHLLLVEKHELPVVNLHVVFPAGCANDGKESPGLVEMTAAVWDEGTAKRSAEEIASELGGMGASVSVSADWDTTSLRLFSLKRHLPKALEVFTDVLRRPTFPAQELHRQQLSVLGRFTQIRNEPTVLASLAATQLLYGYDHPYGHPQWGNPTIIKEFKPADLKRFYEAHMRPEQAAVIVVGDIAMDELKQQLEESLGDWKSTSSAPVGPEFVLPQPKPTRLVLIDKPHAAQSVIYLALIGTRRNTPDFFPQNVMNMVFGGQFSSRLNLNLREEKGYTYGARSAWDWRVNERGPFVATSSVQTAVTAPALSEFLKELDGMVGTRPVTEKELDFCKKFATRGYTAGFETPSQVATQLETLFAYSLPDDYFNTVVPGVRAVTAADTTRVAKEYLDLDRLAIVVVGDRAKIESELRKLPVGKDLMVYQFDDNFQLRPVKP